MPAGSFTRPVDDRCGPGPGRHGRGQDLHTLPRGRGCRRASWSRPRQLPLVDAGGEVHAAGLSIGADQDQGDTAAGRTSTRSHVAGCRRASWSRPSTASPGRCRRRFSIRPVLDRPGGRPWTWTPRRRDARPGPPGHGRGDGRRQTHHGLAIDRPGVAPGRPPRRRCLRRDRGGSSVHNLPGDGQNLYAEKPCV